jgi:hypothetical protein
MQPPSRMRSSVLLLAAGGAVFCAVSPASAQQGDGFLFGRPWVSMGISLGYAVPRAGSEIFDFTREQLTIERSDFGAPTVHGEVAVRVNERLDVGVGLGWAGSETRSEFRHWWGTDELPIEQTTRFSRVPLTVGVKGYLFDRGRSLGRYAWVPNRWSPYVGAGVGGVWYQFVQEGEFFDYESLDIFQDHYLSNGWAPTAHVRAGADLSVATRLVLSADGRYGWARTKLSRDFVDFDEIDLAGFQATLGLSLRF